MFSIVIPACDEERCLPACLDAVARAVEQIGDWFVVRHPIKILKLLRNDRELAHEIMV